MLELPRSLLCTMAVLSLLTACGQAGDLYLPDRESEDAAVATPASSSAGPSSAEDAEKTDEVNEEPNPPADSGDAVP